LYDIYKGSNLVGSATVKKEGMYYKLTCVCRPVMDGRYRIKVYYGREVIDLGICVPEGGNYTLVSRILVKKLLQEKITFVLEEDSNNPLRVGIAPEKHFPYLDKLTAARFLYQNGQPVIIIDPNPVRQGSDPSQEHPHRSVLP
jgi:hypothetical protein